MNEWQPIETAPKDGTEIIIRGNGEESEAFWSESPQCILDTIRGTHSKPSWATCGVEVDYNLPLDEPDEWILKPCIPSTKGEIR